MQTSIRKWGNSAGAIIPASILKKAGVMMNDQLEIEVVEGRIVLRPAAPSYTLADLLKASPESAFVMDAEDRQWLDATPVGKEEI
ncbi:AbrB/MazE/SpoVT family DNA-binding domain-containing protein [Aeromonas veronii]|uniref:AbrB/MazE/SpoVT family DNA-binding domain-containing protein n=1 Tax=Aeromonas TaxID=642 RepID=UPI002DC906E8|nr:AbrB/MazE/SpoVT family DNA-binding domain-containing protein [Aeromonas veronii]